MKQEYLDVVRLLVRVAPVIFAEPGFALKGGTAINLFVRDLPRLSVDLDLVFMDYQLERTEALAAISAAVGNMATRVRALGLLVRVPLRVEGEEAKLLIRQGRIEVKVEINQVLRGTIHPVMPTRMVAAARERLKADLRLPVLAPDELYGSKLVAAMDRNHPRDWFDVMLLLGQQGITPAVRRCFVAYLASHNRPPHEVLFGPAKPLVDSFSGTPMREFLHVDDMAAASVHVMELSDAVYRAHTQPMLSHINVGTGADVTIAELAQTVARVSGFKGKLAFDASKPDGTPRKLLDVSRLAALGWRSQIALEEGLRDAYKWFVANRGSARSA